MQSKEELSDGHKEEFERILRRKVVYLNISASNRRVFELQEYCLETPVKERRGYWLGDGFKKSSLCDFHSASGFHNASTELNLVLVESAPWLRGTSRMVIAIIMVVVFWEVLKSVALYLKRYVWDIPVCQSAVKILLVIEEKILESIGERRLFQFMCYLMGRNRLDQLPGE